MFEDGSSLAFILSLGVTVDTLRAVFPLAAAEGYFNKPRNHLRSLQQLQAFEDTLELRDQDNLEKKSSARSLKDNECRVLVETVYAQEADDLTGKFHNR